MAHRLHLRLAVVGALFACDGGALHDEDESTGSLLNDAWIEPGWGKEAFHSLADGDDYPIVLGGQGAYMFTLPLQAGGFVLPDKEVHWTDPSVPTIEAWLDIDGYDTILDSRAHFTSVIDYPLTFRVLEDGTYEYVRVSLLLPDGLLGFDDILGRGATLHLEVQCGDGQFVLVERRLIVSLSD